MEIYFSDHFKIDPSVLEEHGAFNISLVTDLPLFVDPFLLFNSTKPEYQELHRGIIAYLKYLRDNATGSDLDPGQAKALYCFPEVDQTWLGFSRTGNKGSGLGPDFARSLHRNLSKIFTDFGSEKITRSSHLERLCLIHEGVGRDHISDFTLNLIKGYLAKYTQEFAREHVDPSLLADFSVTHANFNYATGTWESIRFRLPKFNGEYVLLVPNDLLTRDDTWINRSDLIKDFDKIPPAISDDALRYHVNEYFCSMLTAPEPSKKEQAEAAVKTVLKFPELLDYFIRFKEDHGDQAVRLSDERVKESASRYVHAVGELATQLFQEGFYDLPTTARDECRKRALFLKNAIENRDAWRIFYNNGKPVQRELDAQIMFQLTWFGTGYDVNREVNNGRGPVDFKASKGVRDKAVVEVKLAKSSQLKKNLANQVEIYKRANDTDFAIVIILYFKDEEKEKLEKILADLELAGNQDIVLIDARSDNKPSASKAASH